MIDKEKLLNSVASIILFAGKFILIPSVSMVVLFGMYTLITDINNKPKPIWSWLSALLIVGTMFLIMYLITWAWKRRSISRPNMKPIPTKSFDVLEKVTYESFVDVDKVGCKGCDLFGKRCDKLLDSSTRPSCTSPQNIIFKIKQYNGSRFWPDGDKSIELEFTKKLREAEALAKLEALEKEK